MLRHAAKAASLALAFCAIGCDPGIALAPQALRLVVASPLGNDNPFADPAVKFVALSAEGPGIIDGGHQIVLAYTPAMSIDLGNLLSDTDKPVPYGEARQFRLELYPADVNDTPTFPIKAHGRSIPVNIRQGEASREISVYVTKVNHYAGAVNANKIEAQVDARAGASVIATPDNNVMIIGGATPKTAATDAWDPDSYGNLTDTVLLYNPDRRELLGPVANLNKGRAFAASALGVNGLVAVAGGYMSDATGKAAPTNRVEYLDPAVGAMKLATPSDPGREPSMLYPRVGHSITRMFDNSDYFLIAGGTGPKGEAAKSWEIWHPVDGSLTQGPLSGSRFNHCAVRVPDATGGYIMLIGGEDGSGALNNFEVIRYDDKGNVAYKGNKTITCSVGASHAKNGDCDALKGQPGYRDTSWEPIVQPLAGNAARTLPGCAYVPHPGPGGKFYVYMIGGFEDAKKTKPMDRIDVFNLLGGGWVEHKLKLNTARGAPQIGVSSVGPRAGQILISGGLGPDGQTVATGEVVYLPSTGALDRRNVEGTIPGGGRVGGAAVGLVTGHVLVVGGVTVSDKGLAYQGKLSLWSPL
jgi:hypothetical protein